MEGFIQKDTLMEILQTLNSFEEDSGVCSIPTAKEADWTQSEWFQTWLQLARGEYDNQTQDDA
jgi:hypothetical protein